MITWKKIVAGLYHGSAEYFDWDSCTHKPLYIISVSSLPKHWDIYKKDKVIHTTTKFNKAKLFVDEYRANLPPVLTDMDVAMSMSHRADTEQAKKQREINEKYEKHMRETYGKPVH